MVKNVNDYEFQKFHERDGLTYVRTSGSISDSVGNEALVSKFGQLIVGQRKDDVLCRFEYGNSGEEIVSATVGLGSVGNADSVSTVSTSGVGSAYMKSRYNVMYRPGHEIFAFQTFVFSAPAAGSDMKGGIFDGTDGYAFGYKGTAFGIFRLDDGTEHFYPQTEWNGDKLDGTGKSGFNLDKQSLNIYQIRYGWLGIAPIDFMVYGGSGKGWIRAHTIDLVNSQLLPSIASPSNPLQIRVDTYSGAGNVSIGTASWEGGSIEGASSQAGRRIFAGTTDKASLTPNVENHVVTFRNKTTFNGKTNKVKAEAVFCTISTEGNKPVKVFFRRDAVITGGTYSDVDTNESVMEINTTATSFTNGKFEFVMAMQKADSKLVDLGAGRVHLQLMPGETMTISAISAATSEITIGFRWEEYFS